MAVNQLAARAVSLTQQYGPKAIAAANKTLALATNGKASDVTQLASYVKSPQQLSVATQALAAAGIPVGAVFTDDLIGNDRALAAIRDSANRVVQNAQGRFAAGSDNSLQQGTEAAAADLLRIKRVQAALRVFGNPTDYFLCLPNGGIPAEDFAYELAMRRSFRG